ncbi:MAG TPA: hypothetical protein VGA40_03275 [Candidatus Acidoferrales bacterium]
MRVDYAVELDDAAAYEVPWRNAATGNAYLDLRATPRSVEQIEPARTRQPLRGFLTAVNSADSVFATLACRADNDSADPGVFHSEVALMFAVPEAEFNYTRQVYEDLSGELLALLMRDAGADTVGVLLSVRRCRYLQENRAGFCLVVHLEAQGESSGQAELRWGLALARIQQALLYASRVIRHHLPRAEGAV